MVFVIGFWIGEGERTMEIPAAHFGCKAVRTVANDAMVRVELCLPAVIVQKLAQQSSEVGCSMSEVMKKWLAESGHYLG